MKTLSRASDIIGMDVRDSQNQSLGDVKDLIVSLHSGQTPYAVIGFGGALGIGETRVAVPVSDLKRSGQGYLTLSATKEQLKTASKTPSGAWMAVANEPWTKNIDRFYGQPAAFQQSQFGSPQSQAQLSQNDVRTPGQLQNRFEREGQNEQSMENQGQQGREYVRSRAEEGNQNQADVNQNLQGMAHQQGQGQWQHAGTQWTHGARKLCKASDLIGKNVHDSQNQSLGEVKDIIVDPQSGRAPFAVLSMGGTLGIGGNLVAVPFHDLKRSSDGQITISATKEQLQSSSKTASGAWASVANESWAKDIDHFYGQPRAEFGQARYERQEQGQGMENQQGREYVRTPTEHGAKAMSHPDDNTLKQRVKDQLDRNASTQGLDKDIQIEVQSGVVTLKGQVDNQAQKQTIAENVKEIAGVQRVDNQLKVKGQ